mgnify:CR=1 FL=1
MSKVKQFHLREGTLVEGKSLGCLNVYLASDYEQLKEKLAVTTDCADAYSRMFEEVSEDRERVMAERDTLRKQLDEAQAIIDQQAARIAELEALLGECRLALCPFDCKLLLLRIDTALAKKELSE